MKLLTFLGLGKYDRTTYRWEDQSCTTRFSPVASCQFAGADEVVVFLTEEVEQQVYPDFKADLPPNIRVQPVHVPLGASEVELWQIFDCIAGSVQPGEAVAFDVTNGLRSFPLLGLLAAAFLHSGIGVDLQAVFYGAFDLSRAMELEHTPVFDLSPMLALLGWSAAADRFNRTGDSRALASLVREQKNALAKKHQGDNDKLAQIGKLGNLAGALNSTSMALRLIRPMMAMESAHGLAERIEAARPALEYSPTTRPFSMLLGQIDQTYSPLGLETPLAPDQLWASLATQKTILGWYADRDQWAQAVTLAREWLVSWFMLHLELVDIISKDDRDRVEQAINAEAFQFKTAKQSSQSFKALFLGNIPALSDALDLWNRLTDVRNDINHAGMRPDPGKPDSLVANICTCLELLNQLPMEPTE